MQVGVHPGLEHRNAAEFAELRRVGVVVEGAGDQHIEVGIARLAGGSYQVGASDCAKLRSNEDSRTEFRAGISG